MVTTVEVTVVVTVDETVMVEACAEVTVIDWWHLRCSGWHSVVRSNGAGVHGDEDSGNGGQQRYCY